MRIAINMPMTARQPTPALVPCFFPHWGHILASLLIWRPHSLQARSGMEVVVSGRAPWVFSSRDFAVHFPTDRIVRLIASVGNAPAPGFGSKVFSAGAGKSQSPKLPLLQPIPQTLLFPASCVLPIRANPRLGYPAGEVAPRSYSLLPSQPQRLDLPRLHMEADRLAFSDRPDGFFKQVRLRRAHAPG